MASRLNAIRSESDLWIRTPGAAPLFEPKQFAGSSATIPLSPSREHATTLHTKHLHSEARASAGCRAPREGTSSAARLTSRRSLRMGVLTRPRAGGATGILD